MIAQTIDDVISQLDEVIARARREQSRLGYFAILYRNVTVRVKEGIAAGSFEDGARMERLDVTFANRYLDALERYRRGEPASRCWQASFRAADSWFPIVLQHLLLGINAHINLDLGVAAALTSPGEQLAGLRKDFDGINNILCVMLDEVQDKLSLISPYMTVLDRVGCRADEAMMNFSINKARVAAWSVAEHLATLEPEQMQIEIERLDRRIEMLAYLVRYPGVLVRIGNIFVRLTENRDVSKLIDTLK